MVADALGLHGELAAHRHRLVQVDPRRELVDVDEGLGTVAVDAGQRELADRGVQDDLLCRRELLDLAEQLVVLAQGLAAQVLLDGLLGRGEVGVVVAERLLDGVRQLALDLARRRRVRQRRVCLLYTSDAADE